MRQRRNKTSTAATLKPVEAWTRKPNLPPKPNCGGSWSYRTRARWQAVWTSSMADEYVPSDVYGLFDLAELWEMYHRHPDPKLIDTIARQEARFGLAPMDRRRLQWEVQKVEAGAKKPPAPARGEMKDPRGVLRVV